jgi:Asp-tRNA(Asn)/Glu-tRNA(Gln) amidotransferase A subunit family amidase
MTLGSVTSAVSRSLSAIERTEPSILAWVQIDADGAREQATTMDDKPPERELPLRGLTVGVKDLIDVAGLPTVAGFGPFARRVATTDAAVVASLRAAGAIILGKTTTTQFGMTDPTPTRNPWDLARTPGGSSSGSAAAVAAGQVDLAIGSQTGGSVLRPASYCGIVGFKPGFGWASRDGMLPLAPSLDTVGLLSRDVVTVARAFDALESASLERAGTCEPEPPARIGVWQDACTLAEPSALETFEAALANLRLHGAEVQQATHPVAYRDMLATHTVVMMTEAGASHARLIRRHPDAYAPRLRAFVETGLAIPGWAYARALLLLGQFLETTQHAWQGFDVIAFPTVAGGAPAPDTTGVMTLQGVVSLLGLPAMTLPMGLDQAGLPLGLQLVAPHPHGNVRLLRQAAWVAQCLPTLPTPPHSALVGD